MSQNVRIYQSTSCHEFASQFGLEFFYYAKNLGGNRTTSASVYFNGQRPAIVTSGAGRQTHRIAITWTTTVCGCVHTFERVRAHACTCVRSCVRDVFAIYDNNIWPRLIMIIIKKILFHIFIQIRHTDDFPSTGTRLVCIIHERWKKKMSRAIWC